MKRSKALVFLVIAVALTVALGYKCPLNLSVKETTTNNTSNENTSATNTEKTFILTELGCPLKELYSEKQLDSRIPWDLCVFDGKLFIGCGDYDKNTGPCDIWQYDLTTQEWSVSGRVDDEAIVNFEIIDNRLIATGTDPKATWENGSFYTYTPDGWQTDRSVPFGIHMFDIARCDGKTFYAIGNQNNTQSPVQMTLDGVNYTNVPFYIDDVALLENPDYGFSRCYNLFESDNGLFAFCWLSDNQNQPKIMGIFKFDGNGFHFISKLTDLKAENLGGNRQLPLNKSITYNNKFYFSTGYLYSTESFESLEKINIPNGAYVEDMTVDGDKLYILTSSKDNDEFLNTIWEYNETEGLKEIYSFNYKQSAISLEKHNDIYFVGIGKMTDSNTEVTSENSPALLNGNIIKIELK